MRRFSPFLLVIAASSAAAQDPPTPASEAATEAATPTEAPATTQPPATDPSSPATPAAGGTQNARLAPGGVMESGSTFPLGIQANLSTSLGNGWLAHGYQVQPLLSTVLSLTPSAKLPKLEGLPTMRLSGGISFSVGNWFSTSVGVPAAFGGGVYDRQLRVSDAAARLILPGIFTEEFTGISASLVVGATAPISIVSRQSNLITSLNAAMLMSWSSPELGFGSFFAQYTPSARASLYSQVGTTMPCGAQQQYGTPRRLGDPVNGTEDLPTFIAIGGDPVFTDNGECLLPGRQIVGAVTNSLNTGWSSTDGAHSVTLGIAWQHLFLRGLSNKPELNSQFSSGQGFSELTSGSASYTYSVPVDFPLQLSLSAGSVQGVYNANNELLFPFWDFRYPANNSSGFSFDVTVGI